MARTVPSPAAGVHGLGRTVADHRCGRRYRGPRHRARVRTRRSRGHRARARRHADAGRCRCRVRVAAHRRAAGSPLARLPRPAAQPAARPCARRARRAVRRGCGRDRVHREPAGDADRSVAAAGRRRPRCARVPPHHVRVGAAPARARRAAASSSATVSPRVALDARSGSVPRVVGVDGQTADLVVDARGPRSSSADWLAAIGARARGGGVARERHRLLLALLSGPTPARRAPATPVRPRPISAI